MVRLLPTRPCLKYRPLAVFQSHNGAIAANWNFTRWMVVSAVSIPQWCDCCEPRDQQVVLYFLFQSHNGAIAAQAKATKYAATIGFQSHNGAIAAFRDLERMDDSWRVSIPQWCDCCQVVSVKPTEIIDVSIPQWCDCCYPQR